MRSRQLPEWRLLWAPKSGGLCVLLCALALPTAAQTVTDGDTLKLNGTTYRLWGIDAPETKQACADGWRGGIEATKHIRELIEGHTVTCEPRTTDRYGRTVALCRADGVDIGAAMVSAGYAWAFVRYSRDYEQQDREAREAHLGIHAHGCEVAWEYRARIRGDQ